MHTGTSRKDEKRIYDNNVNYTESTRKANNIKNDIDGRHLIFTEEVKNQRLQSTSQGNSKRQTQAVLGESVFASLRDEAERGSWVQH